MTRPAVLEKRAESLIFHAARHNLLSYIGVDKQFYILTPSVCHANIVQSRFIAFMENPEKTWNDFLAKEEQKAPPELSLFD